MRSPVPFGRTMCLFALVLGMIALPGRTCAWVYPEHRRILLRAIEQLSAADRALLDSLWSSARSGRPERFTLAVIEPGQGRQPEALDYAAWAGLAGDHSCSPQAMLQSILYEPWVLEVADITARLQADLLKARRRDQTNNAIRTSDIRLQRADPEYATRAGANNVHFLLARMSVLQGSDDYFEQSLRAGAPLNALGTYAWYHALAQRKAAAAGAATDPAERAAYALGALADEAFALHFLQDVYASGHAAGTWGSVAHRKGTHDHYNEAGLEVELWNGERHVLTGDAYMREVDEALAAVAVRLSLEQLLRTARVPVATTLPAAADTFNVCAALLQPEGGLRVEAVREVLLRTPVPGLPAGLGELPRFRAEIGPFVGVAAALNALAVDGGFVPTQEDPGGIGGLNANVMVGLGMDGVLNRSGDGLAFLQVGWRKDAASSQQFIDAGPGYAGTSLTAVIPARNALDLRLRLPFWLIPGDLVLAAPVLGLTSPNTLQRMAVTAANGGVLHMQSGVSTPVGLFQFMLGREVGLTLFGRGDTPDALFVPDANGQVVAFATYRSTRWEFPFLEYRPTRTFSQEQTASLKVQLAFGVDTPSRVQVVSPADAPPVQLEPVWFGAFRLVFEWRRYL